MDLLAKRLERLGSENAFKIGDDIRRVEQMGLPVIKLNLGEPDFNSPEGINRTAIENIRQGNSHYTDPQGVYSFRESIARHIEETRGVAVDPNRVVVISGGKPTIGYTLLTYVNPGDEVIYPNPGFPIYESWINFVQATPRPLDLREETGFRFDLAELERLVTPKTKLIILNSPSNPTGGVLTEDDLVRTAGLLKAGAHPKFRILSDEVYDHILFDGRRHRSIISQPEMADRTIILNSHSKTFAMTGWRVGYAVLPTVEEALIFRQWNINTYSCTPPFIQEAARDALDDPRNKVIVGEMTEQFQQRRDIVVEALNRIDGITCATPAGAFYAFPNIALVCERLGILDYYRRRSTENADFPSPSTMFQLFALYRHQVATLDRPAFGVLGSEGRHFLRISLASDLAALEEGVRRLKAATEDEAGFRQFAKEHFETSW